MAQMLSPVFIRCCRFDADPFLLDVATTMVSNENVTFNSTCVNKYTGLVTQVSQLPLP